MSDGFLLVLAALVSLPLTGAHWVVLDLYDMYKKRHQRWRCRRCGQEVDMKAFRCGCTTSPSPWEPIP
jgi:hypothetical protein